MKTQELRQKYLQFFKERGHRIVPSSPVLPHNDPSLLFINAGMNQFKEIFLGKIEPPSPRAVSAQKCIRVGGKHNDLENVGHTRRHLTFFEMLGNFSFGDYFKKEAIQFAWEVTLSLFNFDEKRVWASVYCEDDESFELWKEFLPEKRIVRLGDEDNFWTMGDTGPCGPCSELLFDRGEAFGDAPSPLEDSSGERYFEFWNLVFMEKNRDAQGTFHPLPNQSVDTGCGLERLMTLHMNVESVFETDLFQHLIACIGKEASTPYAQNPAAFHVISDHIRTLAFAIADGVTPSNLDRGYVLRKVARRAVRYARQIGIEKPFLAKLIAPLIELMGDSYPELVSASSRIEELVTSEEESFFKTLHRGGNLMQRTLEKGGTISGEEAFSLKDTYGLPLEEILLLAKDAGRKVDLQRYEELEQKAKERSRKARKETVVSAEESLLASFPKTLFVGEEDFVVETTIEGILANSESVSILREGEKGVLLLDTTPFYAESGGQVGDIGEIQGSDGSFLVENTLRPFTDRVAHVGKVVRGEIHLKGPVTASIDVLRREKIRANHTATHLLHWALEKVLGPHVRQAGSLVDDERLRFDFSHHKPLTDSELVKIEELVNEKGQQDLCVTSKTSSYNEVQGNPLIKQFFGEKYGDQVRVVDIGGESMELCGGSHLRATGQMGLFRIVSESGIASGVRRIEAVTGQMALHHSQQSDQIQKRLAALLKVPVGKLEERMSAFLQEHKETQQKLSGLRKQFLALEVEELLSKVNEKGAIPYLIAEVDLEGKELKEFADLLQNKRKSLVLLLGSKGKGRCQLLARVSSDLVKKGITAKALILETAPLINGKGGGRDENAQAGGSSPEHLEKAFQQGVKWIERFNNDA